MQGRTHRPTWSAAVPSSCLCAPQVKQLRLEREREKAMREQELEMLQREKEAEHFKTWEEQEDNFHLQQAKLRCGQCRALYLLSPLSGAQPCCLEPATLAALCHSGLYPLLPWGPSLTPFLAPLFVCFLHHACFPLWGWGDI